MNSFFRQAGVCTGYSWKFHRDWGSFYFVFKKWEFQGPGSTSRRYTIFSGATQKAGVAILPVTQNKIIKTQVTMVLVNTKVLISLSVQWVGGVNWVNLLC